MRFPVMRTLHTLPLLSRATSNLPPCALYSSMTAAITAATITMAPTANQFLPLVRCPRRPRVLLLRLVRGALRCPAGLFFLLRFVRFSHGLPLCYGAVVVVARAV